MTDKEILAELKKCFEYLYDITENASEEQITEEDKRNIFRMKTALNVIYENLFQKTHENIRIKEHDELIIADNVYDDYYDKEIDDFVGKDDVIINGKEYEWWDDYEFLTNI